MTFKRIDEDTIRCIISADEMIEYGIEMEDFFRDKEKVNGFLETLLKEAVQEVGELHHHGVMSMQIMPLSKNRLSITFSEKASEGSLGDVLEYIKQSLQGLDELPEGLREKIAAIPGISDSNPEIEEHTSGSEEEAADEKISNRIFLFDSLEILGSFCRNVSCETVHSRLYKKAGEGYLLVLEKEEGKEKYFHSVCELAMEYSSRWDMADAREAFLEEHAECMIEEEAIQKLAELFAR